MKSARKKWEQANSGSFRRENFFLVTKTEKNGDSEEQELIAIQSAEEDYDTSVVDQQQSLSDII